MKQPFVTNAAIDCIEPIVLKKSVWGREPADRQNIVPLGPDDDNAVCRRAI